MEARSQEVAAIVRKITGLHAAIAKLTSQIISSPYRQWIRRLCSDAEARLEERYSDEVAAAPTARSTTSPASPTWHVRHVARCDVEHALLLARHHLASRSSCRARCRSCSPRARFDCYDRSAAATGRARRLARALGVGVSFRTAADVDARRDLAAYDVVFLAAENGEADVVVHLCRHMAPGAALVVEAEAVARAGFDVLDVCRHRDDGDGDAVVRSVVVVVVARKAADGAGRDGNTAAWHVSREAPACGCGDATTPSERRRGGGKGGRKRPVRSCRLDAINEARRRAW
uniref:Nicotianamine synthase n=1 Tax=Leersia perrieri TaxID=77586 RepID=A0A0D9VGV4_9ORYZ